MGETSSGERATWAGTIPAAVTAAVTAIPVDIDPGPAAAMMDAGGWLSADRVTRAARLVVAAWLAAVNGDDSALRALAELALSEIGGDDDDGHDAAFDLLHPVRQDWVIAPDPDVTRIDLWVPDRSGNVPKLRVRWWFTGSRQYDGPALPPGWTSLPGQEYVGSAHLRFREAATEGTADEPESGPFPWRLTDGYLETIDEYYGYQYRTSDETPEEYRSRTGTAAYAAALIPSGTYQLVASFAEHDHKFSGDATADVDSDVPLTRDEAQDLAADAMNAEARRRMDAMYPYGGADMEARPSLNLLRVIRLLDPAPPVDPAAELTGPALDEFAQRYAASRLLTYATRRTPEWRDPGPWFLSMLDITRSHGRLAGKIGGGPHGELWYAEGAARGWGRSREQWIVARYLMLNVRRAGSIAVAVRRKRGLFSGGSLPRGLTEVPRGLTQATTGDERFDQRFAVGAAVGDLIGGERPWASRLLTAELTSWLREQPYGEDGAEATCFQLQGGLICVYTRGWPTTADALDAFCDRAAHLASAIEHATSYVIQ